MKMITLVDIFLYHLCAIPTSIIVGLSYQDFNFAMSLE